MNVSCPSCHTIFRVDPRKVPTRGVRARCARCPAIFAVRRGEENAAVAGELPTVANEAPAEGAAPATAPKVPDGEPSESLDVPQPPASREPGEGDPVGTAASLGEAGPGQIAPALESVTPGTSGPAATGEAPPSTSDSDPPAVQIEAPGDSPAPTPDASPFGFADPTVRARRLARALVSDIVVYHPERRDRSLREGTLRQEFREEIRKSWDEYVAQVGNQIARETSYFRDALNEILAGDSRVF